MQKQLMCIIVVFSVLHCWCCCYLIVHSNKLHYDIAHSFIATRIGLSNIIATIVCCSTIAVEY